MTHCLSIRCQSFALWVLSLGAAVDAGFVPVVWAADPNAPAAGAPSASQAPASSPPAATPAPPQGGDQQMDKMHHVRKACAADVKKFCAQVKPGGGRILECLEEHSKEVSDDCYEKLEKRMERQKGGKQ